MSINYMHCLSIIGGCITTKDLKLGKLLHSRLIKTSFIFDTILSNRLIQLYAKCGSMKCAHNVFHELPLKNDRSWNILVSGYCSRGHFDRAYQLLAECPELNIVGYNAVISGLSHRNHEAFLCFFKRMQRMYNGLFLDDSTIISVLGVCTVLRATQLLHQLHGVVVVLGLEFHTGICNALIDSYGKLGYPDLSYGVFTRMVDRDVVSWSSMVSAFIKSSRLEDASRVFHQTPLKNTVSWTTLITGFTKDGQGMEALSLFGQMQKDGVPPNAFTYVAALGACSGLALIEKGKQFHGRLIRSNNKDSLLNLHTCNALINMYCKCGDLRSASVLFDSMLEKDTISWNSLINGFAQNGHYKESLALFERMMALRLRPNNVTFLGVLSACCHTGLLNESMQILDLMGKQGLKPELEHYAIIIDLLGRKNLLEEAFELIEKAPGGSNHVGMWGALLGACRVHGKTDLAKKAAEMLFMLEPSNTARYVMLSNIYSAGNQWDDYQEVRRIMDEKGLRKEAGFSWIEVKDRRHGFIAKDKSHCCQEEIYEIYTVLLPIIIFVIRYFKRKDVHDLHHAILGILYAVLITGVITDAIKDAVGRPRPNFFWRCFPDGMDFYDQLGDVICNGDPSDIKEGDKSFPSGHTSWSFAGLGFLSLYLAAKLQVFDQRGHVGKLCIVLLPLLFAALVGVSRVDDYWHHWTDVFTGALIGLTIAVFCYLQFFPAPHRTKGWGTYSYFTALEGESRKNGDNDVDGNEGSSPHLSLVRSGEFHNIIIE